MRPLEILLVLANGLVFFALAVPTLRASRWARYAAFIVLVIAGAQLLVEGPRWQMVPAYLLSAVLFLIGALRTRGPARAPRRRSELGRIAAGVVVALGALLLVVSATLPILIPVFRFPKPAGPYAIGTLTYHWVDTARSELFTADPNDRRELMVQLWYPARGNRSSPRARYVQDGAALAPLARLFRLPGFAFGQLKYVTTNAIPAARAADGEPYPVLIFSHGRGGFRQHNTLQVEELVSHGYIVAAIDHPYAASGVVFPDGRLVTIDARLLPGPKDGSPGDRQFVDDVAIPYLARDVIFTLDRLAALNQADPNGILTGRLDLRRAGAFGVSLGGAVIAEACRMEPRLRACLAMDVFMPADVVQAGLRQPTMWISRDARSMKLEGWHQSDIDETQTTMRTVFEKLPGDGYLVLVPGTFHPNFSDFPLFSPLVSWLGLIGPIDARRAHDIIDEYSLAFFDRHLKGRPAPLLDARPSPFPEVIYESRR